MSTQHMRQLGRREFLGGLTLTGTVGLLGLYPKSVAAEPLPETTRIRFVVRRGSVCAAPMQMTEDLLHGEGFTEVQYVEKKTNVEGLQALASGEGDVGQNFLGPTLILIDAGDPLVLLAGVHVGCLEVIVQGVVRSGDRRWQASSLKGQPLDRPGQV